LIESENFIHEVFLGAKIKASFNLRLQNQPILTGLPWPEQFGFPDVSLVDKVRP